jgi:hypothetical protein
LRPVSLTGGLDVASAFYFRGYEQADRGPVIQPYLNIFGQSRFGEDVVLRPYVALFHSAHPAGGNNMADMSDVMLGVAGESGRLRLDARYAWYTMNPLMRGDVHELGAKASFDLIPPTEEAALVSLRPFAAAYAELSDANGTEDVFVNVGIEPFCQIEAAGHRIGVGLPLDWGLSADRYYFDRDGSNAPFGYFSAALTTSVAIPTAERHGQWFLNTSVQYLYLDADSVRLVTGGDDDAWIAKAGVSFVY